MPEPLLSVKSLQAGYGDVQVLWGVDIAVEGGEIACLVGSNGAGKTTLLRAISGIIDSSAGSIVFNNSDITNAGPEKVLRAGVAHVPEGRRLFSWMSVEDNLLMGAYMRRDSAQAIRLSLEKAYELFPILRDRRKQNAGTLSGGEQQMCAIARGLMSVPRLLIIDELSLGLAPSIVDQLCDTLQSLNREGLTILVVEQDIATALDLARHTLVMDTGRVTRAGPSAELRNDPAIREAYLGAI